MVKATVPVGAMLPDAGVMVAVNDVVPLAAMLAGLAAAARLVCMGPPVMFKITEPVELLSWVVPAKEAVMLFAPNKRLVPGSESAAVAPLTEFASDADPSAVSPMEKLTVPVGATEPEVWRTVAVNWVVPLFAMDAGLAVTVVVVGMVVDGRMTVTDTIDGAKAVLP
jgi:hypothetical protein